MMKTKQVMIMRDKLEDVRRQLADIQSAVNLATDNGLWHKLTVDDRANMATHWSASADKIKRQMVEIMALTDGSTDSPTGS